MEISKQLINLLPNVEEIESILTNYPEAKYILQKSLKTLQEYNEATSGVASRESDLVECTFLVQVLVHKFWEQIHTGLFSEVAEEIRKIFALASFCKILFLLIECMERPQIEKCSETLDEAILMGITKNVFANSRQFMDTLTEFFDNELDATLDFQLPIIEKISRHASKCDIQQLEKPSLNVFNEKCFKAQNPALLLNTIGHWPAFERWRDLNYILKLAGNRTVPIEIGSNYATDEWSQQLMKIKDFLKRQFSKQETAENPDIEYLAQHELFEQIPQLKKDFSIPDYCMLGTNDESVDIKAWLGPKGTISPLHFDPKHNILCQVFGSKSVILAAPVDSENLYPHEGEFLSNTSQINAMNLDLKQFPNVSNVKFYKLTLFEGDCLYMPPKWWHYIQSESPSFSVSFWWT